MALKLDRRTFLKLSGAAVGSLTLGDLIGSQRLGDAVPVEVKADGTKVIAAVCNHNCGGRCRIQAHVKDGVVVRITSERGPDSAGAPQLRACLKGRALRSRLYHPDRLKYPQKRTGKRGEGRFERITWDEAVEAIATNLKEVVDRHGPGA